MKTIELDLKVTFTQSVEVDVDDDMFSLIKDNWLREFSIFAIHKTHNENKMTDFLDSLIDMNSAGDINVEIELYNEV